MTALQGVASDQYPAWTAEAVALLTPALKIMARPVVLNNLKRVAQDPAHPTQDELRLFVEKVRRGIKTFGSAEQADQLAGQLASRLGVR